jgi:hypothetical protein
MVLVSTETTVEILGGVIVKLYSITCDAPALPLSESGFRQVAFWRAAEKSTLGLMRGGAIVAPKQLAIQGTTVHTGRPVNVDFPNISVRAGAQGLT